MTTNRRALIEQDRLIASSDLSVAAKLSELEIANAAFEMRLDDLIEHLHDIKASKGNVRVLRPDLNAGTMRLGDIHVQKRDDSFDEWAVSIY